VYEQGRRSSEPAPAPASGLRGSSFAFKLNKLSHIDLFVFPQHKFTKNDNIKCIASDLLLLRPCIEHYMLGVILGRGGGPEELGATFWGQTELSCYDDSQHGIWESATNITSAPLSRTNGI
jgi:hypothetical protein